MEGDTVTIDSLLILPIQRVPRYQLLLRELLERTEFRNHRYDELTKALDLIKATATHINETIKRQDQRRRIRELEEKFVGDTEFVSPSRYLIKEGECTKLSEGNRYKQKYYFILFNDLFLYADVPQLTSKYKVHWQSKINASFGIRHVEDGVVDDSSCKFRFEIVTPSKKFVMVFIDEKVMVCWKEAITKCIEEQKGAVNYDKATFKLTAT